MANLVEIVNFIKRYRANIKPLTKDVDALGVISDHIYLSDVFAHGIGEERIVNILEEFETKVFVYGNPSSAKDAKRVLVEAAEPQAFTLMMPIIERLTNDPRCHFICLLTDNLSGKYFGERMGARWQRIDDHSNPMFSDIPGPFDVALVGVEPPNSPNATLLFGAKSVFGATKLFFVVSGWLGAGDTNIFEGDRASRMDAVDGVFCNDELAKKIFLKRTPLVPPELVYVTGTPVVDALEFDKAEQYATEGRKKLGISWKATAILYVGDISGGYKKLGYASDERINEKTFELTLEALKKLATEERSREFALILCPHPRDPNKEELLELAEHAGSSIPSNMLIICPTADDILWQEIRHSADVTLSIVSTENFLTAIRGRPAVFLGYQNSGLGGELLERIYGKEIMEIIGNSPNLFMVSRPDELIQYLRGILLGEKAIPFSRAVDRRDSVKKILDAVLA